MRKTRANIRIKMRLSLVLTALFSLFHLGCDEREKAVTEVVKEPVPARIYYVNEMNKHQLYGVCEEIRSIGQLISVQKQIDADMSEIGWRLQKKDLLSEKGRIVFLSDRIADNTELLKRLIDFKYTESEYIQRLRWDLSAKALGLKDAPAWSLRRVSVEKVYSSAGEDTELRKLLKLESNRQSISLRFKRLASALELCQLQQTIVVHLRVEYVTRDNEFRIAHFKLLASNSGR